MNESLARKFCESPHRKLIVVIVTAVFGLLVLIPLVDDYFDKRESHSTLTEDLDRARKTAEGMPAVEKQVAGVLKKLAAIESRAISDESVSEYRSKVVDLVRDSGCQVRRFDVSKPTRRPWMIGDDPLSTKPSQGAGSKKTPFDLERRNVVLLIDGTEESIQGFLDQLHQDDSLAYLNRLELRTLSAAEEKVTLEIELWLFALARQKV